MQRTVGKENRRAGPAVLDGDNDYSGKDGKSVFGIDFTFLFPDFHHVHLSSIVQRQSCLPRASSECCYATSISSSTGTRRGPRK